MLAPVPVPLVMTVRSTAVTLSAMTSLTACFAWRLRLSSSTLPLPSTTFTIGVGACRNAAVGEHRVGPGHVERRDVDRAQRVLQSRRHRESAARTNADVMPRFFAISAMFFTPTSLAICAYTVLIEWVVADVIVADPPPSPSAFLIVQSAPLQLGCV